MLSASLCFSEEWSLSKPLVEKLITLRTSEDVKNFLVEEYDIHHNFVVDDGAFESEHVKKILLDYFTHAFYFCVSEPLNFHEKTPKKMATFLSLCKYILVHSMRNELSVDESFKHFGVVLVQHSIRRPPWRFPIFDLGDVREITSYFHRSFYKHYKLYQYTFTREDFCDFESKTVEEFKLVMPIIPKPLREMEETIEKEEEEEVEGEKEPMKKKQKQLSRPASVTFSEVSATGSEPRSEGEIEKKEEVEEEEAKKNEMNVPQLNRYVVEQLNEVKDLLVRFQGKKLSSIDEKLEDLEKKLIQMQSNKASTPKRKK